METKSVKELLDRIEELEIKLSESEQLIDAIKTGEVDAFAINSNDQSEIFTLQTSDYIYRILVEDFGEGALNLTEEGLIVYSNSYFYELINIPYEKVVGSFIFEFIEEESKQKFNELFAEGLKGRSKGEINLCVNKKTIPVYISLTSLQPKLSSVGIIITDLTQKKRSEEVILKYQKDLEEKNEALIQSNEELSSFTYIASHDLQEPLRKIQTFCNRILEKEAKMFSPATTDYFNRISAASTRMQNLIYALLNYSRSNTIEIASTDLNTLVEDVITGIKEMIEENAAVINASPLPTLNIDYSQFRQLFSNLIMNAIKYRRQDAAPRINIVADIVTRDSMDVTGEIPDRQYWKISISDNGIGFEQQYADKIFELFQRLHTAKQYEGTGIGLAICKKIIKNHHGFISAVGDEQKGTTINIFLPLNKSSL